MSVQAHRLSGLLLPVLSLAWLGAGCCSQTHSYAGSKSLWESPIVRETRALLSVRYEELSILRVDGSSPRGTRLSPGPDREYFLSAGDHCLTAALKYATPLEGGGVGVVRGLPITFHKSFQVGHKYEVVYRQFVRPLPKPQGWLDHIILSVINPPEEFWKVEIVDVTGVAQATES
jgi:hypothetical protein